MVYACTATHHPNTYMICEACMKKGKKMAVNANDLLGDQYIGAGAEEREPQLSEFSKAAIDFKMKLHKEAEKPRDKSRKEIARCDNLDIQNCPQAVQELRNNWIGDDNQKQHASPTPKGNCCCFSCLKVANKIINFHSARLSLEETEQEEIERESKHSCRRCGRWWIQILRTK